MSRSGCIDDPNGLSFATTNMYQQPQNNVNVNNYYQQQAQQKYNQQYQSQIVQQVQHSSQVPYIDNNSVMSDNNPPLSQYDSQQQEINMNNNPTQRQRRGYQSGQALTPNNDLKYARSAYPVMNTQNEPELHHPVPGLL